MRKAATLPMTIKPSADGLSGIVMKAIPYIITQRFHNALLTFSLEVNRDLRHGCQ